MHRLILVLALGLLPLPALALNDDAGWTDCERNKLATQPSGVGVGPTGRACYEWENSSTDTPFFTISNAGQVCFNGDRDDSTNPPASGGVVRIRKCPGATRSAAECPAMDPEGGAGLNGTEGTPSAQRICVNLGPGRYYGDVTTAIPNGDEAILWITGATSL